MFIKGTVRIDGSGRFRARGKFLLLFQDRAPSVEDRMAPRTGGVGLNLGYIPDPTNSPMYGIVRSIEAEIQPGRLGGWITLKSGFHFPIPEDEIEHPSDESGKTWEPGYRITGEFGEGVPFSTECLPRWAREKLALRVPQVCIGRSALRRWALDAVWPVPARQGRGRGRGHDRGCGKLPS